MTVETAPATAPPHIQDDKYRALHSSTDSLGLPSSPNKTLRHAPQLHHSGYLALSSNVLGGFNTFYALLNATHLDLYASKHAYLSALKVDIVTRVNMRTRLYMIGARITDDADANERFFRVQTATGATFKFRVDTAAMKRSWLDVFNAVASSAQPPQSILNRKQCGLCQTNVTFFRSKARECAVCCRITCADCLPVAAVAICRKCTNSAASSDGSADCASESGGRGSDSESHSHSVTHRSPETTSSPSLPQRTLSRDTAAPTSPISDTAQLIITSQPLSPSEPPPVPQVFRYLTVDLPASPRAEITVLSEDEARSVVDKDTRLRAAPPPHKVQTQQVIRPQRKLSAHQTAYKFPIKHREVEAERKSKRRWWMWCGAE